MESMYGRKTAVNKASVIKQLAKLEYRDGSSVIEHLNVFQGHINQLTAMKINLDDEVQALLLLGSLPDSWNTLVSLSNSAPDGKLTPDMVKNNMLNEEAKRKEKKRAAIRHLLLMHMWLKRKMKIKAVATRNLSKAEVNPGRDHSQVQALSLFVFIAVKKATKEISAEFIKESLHKQSKARIPSKMVKP